MRNMAMLLSIVAASLAGCGGELSAGGHTVGDPCVSGAICASADTLLECRRGEVAPRLCSGDCDDAGIVTCDPWFDTCVDDALGATECLGDHLVTCQAGIDNGPQRWHWTTWCVAGCGPVPPGVAGCLSV